MGRQKKSEPDVIRTRNLLIWSQTRYRCATGPFEQRYHLMQNAYNTRDSQAVTHPSTNRARRCLTSVIRREPVYSTWYGRRRNCICKRGSNYKKSRQPYPYIFILVTSFVGKRKSQEMSVISKMSSYSRDSIVVSTLRCGRKNPGSNPGHGSTFLFIFI